MGDPQSVHFSKTRRRLPAQWDFACEVDTPGEGGTLVPVPSLRVWLEMSSCKVEAFAMVAAPITMLCGR